LHLGQSQHRVVDKEAASNLEFQRRLSRKTKPPKVRDIVCEFAERTIEQTYFFEFRTDIYIQLRLLSIELDPNQWHSGTH